MEEEWQSPKDIKPWMVCAANRNRVGGELITGARHYDNIMREQLLRIPGKIRHSDWEQGFIDQFGRFYNRKDAMKAVITSGQPFNADRNCGGQESEDLYSEGLY